MVAPGGEADSRARSFMRSLVRMFQETREIYWDHGTIVIPDPHRLEKILPQYYRTSKFSSFQRQLNNFGYHRAHDSFGAHHASHIQGVRYHKVVGSPAATNIEDLLTLRPLVRRSKKRDMSQEHKAAAVAMPHPNPILLRPQKRLSIDTDVREMTHAAHCLLSLDRSFATTVNTQIVSLPQHSPALRRQQWI